MPRTQERINEERGIYSRTIDRRKTYEITYPDRFGVQRWETLPAGTGIQQARAIRGTRINDGGPPTRPSRETFASVADAYMAKKRRVVQKHTREGYQRQIDNHLVPRFGPTPIAAIDADDIAELVADLRDEYSAWTVRTIWTPLVGIFGHALRRGLIPESPCSKLEKGERPAGGNVSLRYLDGTQEITAVLAAADERWRLLIAAAIFTGLRIGELLGLLWADVDLRNGFIYVRAQRRPDGERVDVLKSTAAHRDVVLLTDLGSLLKDHIRGTGTTPHPRAPVFATQAGRIPDRTTVRKGLKAACAAAGVEPLRFHDLRHTYASILIVDLERDPVSVARQIGHANPSTTLDTYAKLFDRARNASSLRDQLDGRFGGILRNLGRDA